MTLTERAEAACIELYGNDFKAAQPGDRQSRVEEMVRALRAAYPELYTSPPKAWIAPWTTTRAMDEGDLDDWNYRFHLDWDAARDAHLSATANKPDNP